MDGNTENSESSDNFICSSEEFNIPKQVITNLPEKIKTIPNPLDYSDKMENGEFFEAYAIEYFKNFILSNLKVGLKTKQEFNFFNYVECFCKSKHNEEQLKEFNEIIGLTSQQCEENYATGELDLIINNIKGEYLNSLLLKFPNSIYKCNDAKFSNKNYDVIIEIKNNIFKRSKRKEIQKQFNKYIKIINFLNSSPDSDIRSKMNISKGNEIALGIISNGKYANFDYLSSTIIYNKVYSEDVKEKQKLNKIKHFFSKIKSAKFPVIIIYTPKVFGNKEFKPKYALNTEKEIRDELKKLSERVKILESQNPDNKSNSLNQNNLGEQISGNQNISEIKVNLINQEEQGYKSEEFKQKKYWKKKK